MATARQELTEQIEAALVLWTDQPGWAVAGRLRPLHGCSAVRRCGGKTRPPRRGPADLAESGMAHRLHQRTEDVLPREDRVPKGIEGTLPTAGVSFLEVTEAGQLPTLLVLGGSGQFGSVRQTPRAVTRRMCSPRRWGREASCFPVLIEHRSVWIRPTLVAGFHGAQYATPFTDPIEFGEDFPPPPGR